MRHVQVPCPFTLPSVVALQQLRPAVAGLMVQDLAASDLDCLRRSGLAWGGEALRSANHAWTAEDAKLPLAWGFGFLCSA